MDNTKNIKSDGTAKEKVVNFLMEVMEFYIVFGITLATALFVALMDMVI